MTRPPNRSEASGAACSEQCQDGRPSILRSRGRHLGMASTSFRESMNSMGWSRRDPDIPANTNASTPFLSRLQSYNPFGNSGYVSLPTSEGPGAPLPAPSRREEEEGWFARESSPFTPQDGSRSIMLDACIATNVRDKHFAACMKRCDHPQWHNARGRRCQDHSRQRAIV